MLWRLAAAAAMLLLPGSLAAQGQPENLLEGAPERFGAARTYTVHSGDRMSVIARPAPALKAAQAKREAGAPRLLWPTSGAMTGRFGASVKGLPNNGIDLAAFAGMTVHAAAAGKVLFAGTEPERFGQLILIDHGGGWVTAYAYLGQVRVKEGQTVTRRQVIAKIGKSGEAKRPSLHFELRRENVPRNPALYLPVRL